MMPKSKLLINIRDLKEIEEYKKIGDFNFLFAVQDFSIGYPAFSLTTIPEDSYLLMNRILDTEAIEILKEKINVLKKFKGIFFEDIGVYQILKDTGIPLIWFQNHFATNFSSINFWLNQGCLSAVLSNEITEEEILTIFNTIDKPLVFPIFGKNQIMYSRRTLLNNFSQHFSLEAREEAEIQNGDNKFLLRENKYGTAVFNCAYFNYMPLIEKLNDEKVLYYMILNLDLSIEEIKDILNGKPFGTDGFLNKKTVYKMAEYNDR